MTISIRLTVNGTLYGQMDLGPYINPEQQAGAPQQYAEIVSLSLILF